MKGATPPVNDLTYLDFDVPQLLVVQSVQHVELQHQVTGEDVFHAGHHVLHLHRVVRLGIWAEEIQAKR